VHDDTSAKHEVINSLRAWTPDTAVLAVIKTHVKADATVNPRTGETETTRLLLASLVVLDTTTTLLKSPAAEGTSGLATELGVDATDKLLEHTRDRHEDGRMDVLKQIVENLRAETAGGRSREEHLSTRAHRAMICKHLLGDLIKRKEAKNTISVVESSEFVASSSSEGNVCVAQLDREVLTILLDGEDNFAKHIRLGILGNLLKLSVGDISLHTILDEDRERKARSRNAVLLSDKLHPLDVAELAGEHGKGLLILVIALAVAAAPVIDESELGLSSFKSSSSLRKHESARHVHRDTTTEDDTSVDEQVGRAVSHGDDNIGTALDLVLLAESNDSLSDLDGLILVFGPGVVLLLAVVNDSKAGSSPFSSLKEDLVDSAGSKFIPVRGFRDIRLALLSRSRSLLLLRLFLLNCNSGRSSRLHFLLGFLLLGFLLLRLFLLGFLLLGLLLLLLRFALRLRARFALRARLGLGARFALRTRFGFGFGFTFGFTLRLLLLLLGLFLLGLLLLRLFLGFLLLGLLLLRLFLGRSCCCCRLLRCRRCRRCSRARARLRRRV